MAFFDDRKYLLSHIRHSYIISDDTGMCEMVMMNEVVNDKAIRVQQDENLSNILDYYDNAIESDLLEVGQSYDIVSDMALIGAHRCRSNTAQRLERLKKERKNQGKIKNIQWKENTSNISSEELVQLFPRKDLTTQKKPDKVRSSLSDQLEKFPQIPNNPFNEYARFDGKISEDAQTKRIVIFLMMLPPDVRAYPMEVITLTSARVQDLIGLICWQYTNEGREPKLKPSVAHYCLRIAEENGDVDEDFPSLNPKEPVAKFGFPVLALVEKEKEADGRPVVTVNIADGFSKIQLPDLNVTLREVLEQTLRHRKGMAKFKGPEFRLEKQEEPGIPVNLDLTVGDAGTLEFCLVWENESSNNGEMDEWDSQHMTAMEAPLYQSYTVFMIHKLGRNTEVQLGISGEKVEINPLPQKGTAKLLTRQQKAVTYYMENIAACEMINRKYSVGKAVFKLVYHNGQDFKNHIFETNSITALEIVKKLQYILEMHYSTAQKEYIALKEQKLFRKQQ
ncbi:target of rapamycin complex 2 subunit MAPKAP1-like [Centruroides sculpturatus]|uniref:target of rapamycin complex 2 subunit MAPKAP1-like n=1 Tax=Centruroides sculpturatus TaxID=218467 RepID=UPI000C6E42CB|nr:target of rapamycin complex 2 subunit MAPKAP1-like [Centruroides sculpturatus]